MDMTGEARLGASREQVWEALNDVAALQASIPGCESLERTDDNAFEATVVSKVGPIKARFKGKVTLSNIDAPRSYTLSGEGTGGSAGFAKADVEVNLDAPEPDVTLLSYAVRATVGGKLAQLGSRMVEAAARKSADDFFELFATHVEARSEGAPSAAATAPLDLAALAGSAEGPAPAQVAPSQARADPVTLSVAPTIPHEDADSVADVLTSELIKIWISDQIAVVTLNRPDNRNAMTYAMWRAIPAIFAALDRNPDVRIVILTGAGDDFCAGADVAEFGTVRDDAAQARAYEVAVDACCDAISGIGKPTIAVLRGYCLGGGANLAMSCDFRYASADATLGIPAARLSIIYGVKGTRKLLSLVGLPQAKTIMFGGQRFDAAHALRIGFVDRVSGDPLPTKSGWWSRLFARRDSTRRADPMTDARAFARTLAENAPLTIAGSKFLLNGMAMGVGALDLDRAEQLIAAAADSDDYREGRKAFLENRAPEFKGR
jgi:enoyl-CoA hydratase/carnithine racemase/carbon monoxide dehydrogenase subunit G